MISTELHRHLDVSIRTSTVLELAKKLGFEIQSTSLALFKEKFILNRPLKDLNSVLETFQLCQRVFDSPETIERIAYEVVEDCFNEGLRKVELRFSPGFICEFNGIDWQTAVDSVFSGVKRAEQKLSKIQTGLICIASRDQGLGAAEKTAKLYLNNLDKFVGIDLAGPELEFPARDFKKAFEPVRRAKEKDSRIHITIHAGEADGPQSIWEAIEILGAERIGHGVRCLEDPKLVQYLVDHQICLEVCPTSNWLTQTVSKLENHPLPKLISEGVPCSINTDDPGVFGLTIQGEVLVCKDLLGLSDEAILFCQESADRASFLPKLPPEIMNSEE